MIDSLYNEVWDAQTEQNLSNFEFCLLKKKHAPQTRETIPSLGIKKKHPCEDLGKHKTPWRSWSCRWHVWGSPFQPRRFVELYRGVGSALLKSTLYLGCWKIQCVYPPVNSHSHGKSPCFFGEIHQNGGFFMAMLVYRSVYISALTYAIAFWWYSFKAKCTSLHGQGPGRIQRGKDLQVKCRGTPC